MNTPIPPHQPESVPPSATIEYVTTCKTCGILVQCSSCASLSHADQVMLEGLRRFASIHATLVSLRPSQTSDSSGGTVPPEKGV